MPARVTVYSTPHCPHCVMACKLLRKTAAQFDEVEPQRLKCSNDKGFQCLLHPLNFPDKDKKMWGATPHFQGGRPTRPAQAL